MRHVDSYLPKLSLLQKPSLFSIAFMLVVPSTMSSTVLGQGSTVKPKTAPLKFASASTSIPEDVFFDGHGRAVPATTSLTANQVSATSIGSVLSLLFDSARVSLQNGNDPLVATWVGTVTVPTNMAALAKPKARTYVQLVCGAVNKDANTPVSIFLQLGGKSFVAEFPYGTKHTGDIMRKVCFNHKTTGYSASIVIYAERRNPTSALLVDIDGLDVDARCSG